MSYDGPIIDAHHHLWDLSLGRHPWLTPGDGAIGALGNIDYLRRNYGLAAFQADIGTAPVRGSVFIEALWDRSRPPTEEVDWLEALPAGPGQLAARSIAWAPLRAPDLEDTLAELAKRRSVVGVRETVRWHPDPAKSWAEPGILDDPAWRHGVAALGRHGLMLELLMNPYQAEPLARLAADLPGQMFVVNHCGTPVDRDAEGLARWRAGLALMARQPNIAIKVSAFGSYARDHSAAGLRDVIRPCVDAFGPGRAMFGTDYPVARRAMPYADMVAGFRAAVDDLTKAEQRETLYGAAARLYRFDPD